MKRINIGFVGLLLSALATQTKAQTLNSAYFLEGYTYRHQLNPAFQGESNYIALPALGNFSVTTNGNYGVKSLLYKNPEPGKSGLTTFMNPYISTSEALSGFNSGTNKLGGGVNMAILSAGFRSFGGYNTVELNLRTNVSSGLAYDLFEFMKEAQNRNYSFGDMQVNAIAYAELAFGHSRTINENLSVGAKMKFLLGGGRVDATIENLEAELAGEEWRITGQATIDASVKGLTYETEEKEYNNPRPNGARSYQQVSGVDVDGAGLNGFGIGFDLGAAYKFTEGVVKGLTVSASLLDLGFIRWSNNMQAKNTADEFMFGGFQNIQVNDGPGTSFDDQWEQIYEDNLNDFLHLEDQGDQGGRTTGIGATLNLGADYPLPAYDKLKFGFLSSTRINGPHTATQGRFSANVAPIDWFEAGINYAISTYGSSFGWVLNFHPKGFNVFLGMDHTLGKVTKEFIPLSGNANLCLGLNVTW